MSVPLRLLSSGLAAAGLQWALAVASLLAMDLAPTTWWFALSGLLTAGVSVLTYRLIVRPGPGGDGGGGSPADPPEDEPPPWWPEFERDFRAHADRPTAAV